jgi:hypothetical protein
MRGGLSELFVLTAVMLKVVGLLQRASARFRAAIAWSNWSSRRCSDGDDDVARKDEFHILGSA